MAQRGLGYSAQRSHIAVAALFALNLVPFLALLPAARGWSDGTLRSYTLLPVVVLPTVLLSTRSAPAVYRSQLVVASALCLVAVLVELPSYSLRLADVITTIGTLVFITVLIGRSRRALRDHWRELRAAGATDPLTGALNRRGALAQLESVTNAAQRARTEVGIAVIDLDHFKRINDEYGHATGDEVLRFVCEAASGVVGENGLVVRSGGEELVLLTVGSPVPAVEALMALLAHANRALKVTISAGVVSAEPTALRGNDDLWAAVGVADLALYRAKATGRNRIVRGADFLRSSTIGAGRAEPAQRGLPSDMDRGTRASDGSAAPTVPPAPHRFEGFGPARAPRWRRAIERARLREIDAGARRLYQLMVAWMMVVGMLTTTQQMVVGSTPATQEWVALASGWLFGGVVIVWMRRLRTAWSMTPIFVLGSLFELSVVMSVEVDSRPPALMLSLLAGLLFLLHWPRWVAAQIAVTLAACAASAIVPGRPAQVALVIFLMTGVSLVVALVMVAGQRRREEDAEEELHWWALTDPLTGLGNRRALDLASDVWDSGYVAMIDVDSFKALNDQHGHGSGDEVLRALAAGLCGAARESDPASKAFRIGGDEFVIAGPGALPADLVDRIDSAAGGIDVVPVTVSVGTGEWTSSVPGDADLWEALAVADGTMLGRKRIRKSN